MGYAASMPFCVTTLSNSEQRASKSAPAAEAFAQRWFQRAALCKTLRCVAKEQLLNPTNGVLNLEGSVRPPGEVGWKPAGIPDHRHCRLLRARCERPRRRAAEKRDERAAFHVWMAPAWQEKMQRAAQKSPAVMCPACSRSPDGLLALMESANRSLITRAGSMSQ
jgi:hypothetical protein